MSERVTCTPASINSITACLDCLSYTELKMMMLFLWMEFGSYDLPEDLTTLLEESKCFFCPPESETQILKSKVALFANFLSEFVDIENVAAKVKCFPCLKPGQIDGMILYLICDFLTLDLN